MNRTLVDSDVAEILALEREALRRWCSGDPSGFLELSADDVVYFDPFLATRLEGLPALRSYYEGLRGKVRADRFELLNPVVTKLDDRAALLTFNFVSYASGGDARWNATEVYRKDGGKWTIAHSHWAFTKR